MSINVYIPPPVSNQPNTLNFKNDSNKYEFNNKGNIISCNRNPIVNWDVYNNRTQFKDYLILGPKYCKHTIENPFNNNTRRKTFSCRSNF